MKKHTFFTCLAYLPLTLVLFSADAQASCRVNVVSKSEYGYNIRTGQPEIRRYRTLGTRCGLPKTRGPRRSNPYQRPSKEQLAERARRSEIKRREAKQKGIEELQELMCPDLPLNNQGVYQLSFVYRFCQK